VRVSQRWASGPIVSRAAWLALRDPAGTGAHAGPRAHAAPGRALAAADVAHNGRYRMARGLRADDGRGGRKPERSAAAVPQGFRGRQPLDARQTGAQRKFA